MENIIFKNRCSKWVVDPDNIRPENSEAFEKSHFTCKCSLYVCGWSRRRMEKIRTQIVDKIKKFEWPNLVRLARALDIKIEGDRHD